MKKQLSVRNMQIHYMNILSMTFSKTIKGVSKVTLHNTRRKLEILNNHKDIKEVQDNDPNSMLKDKATINEEMLKIS